MKKSLLLKLFALMAAMMCTLGASAVEAYAEYTSDNKTLTFYYDNQRSTRPGTTYTVDVSMVTPPWQSINISVQYVVFDASFAGFYPQSTCQWFKGMPFLKSITNLNYLKTNSVTNMADMFRGCENLTSLDVSGFNTAQVVDMSGMFYGCNCLTGLDVSSFNTTKVSNMSSMFSRSFSLATIYVGSGWNTASVTNSTDMFEGCTSLMGGMGTIYSSTNPKDKTYAHIDGGPSNPGYFADKNVPIVEAYAELTSGKNLTFYYDDLRNTRLNTTFTVPRKTLTPPWQSINTSVQYVVLDASFADFYPLSTSEWFKGMKYLKSITNLNYLKTDSVKYMGSMFQDCQDLASLDVSGFKTDSVVNMSRMFDHCYSLTSLDLSGFKTDSVFTMVSMFEHCSGLTSVNLGSFKTSKVVDMSSMFQDCRNLTSLDLSSFNTSKAILMYFMFNGCTKLQTIYVGNDWSVAAAPNSTSMFGNCTSLVGGMGTTYDADHTDETYAHIDGGPSNPGYLTYKSPPVAEAYACYTADNTTLTFYYDTQRSSRPGTTYDLNTGSNKPGWYTDETYSSVTQVVFDASSAGARPASGYYWFYNMRSLHTITGMKEYLNTEEMTSMYGMFYYCNALTSLDLSGFNTGKVTSMQSMFMYCRGLTTLDLSSFNTEKVTNMQYMFGFSNGLTSLDLSSFNTPNASIMYGLFYQCNNLATIYASSDWNTGSLTSYGSAYLFQGCTRLVGGQGTVYDANHVDAAYAHIDGGTSNPGYFTEWKEAYACYTPSNTTLTFYYDNQRSSRPGKTYDLNTSNITPGWVTDVSTRPEVTKVVFDPSFANARPTTTFSWFYFMLNLESVTGMSYLNTSEVTNMDWMFTYCIKLTSLDLSGFNTSKVTSMRSIFFGCSDLTSLDLSSWNTSNVTDMEAMFCYCSNLTTVYVGGGWSTETVTNSTQMFYNCSNLVGGQGTTFDANHTDATYAHIDGGPSNPGYFTAKNAGMRGDVNNDQKVDIADATALINYLLYGDATNLNLENANCNLLEGVDIADATSLINYLLYGTW